MTYVLVISMGHIIGPFNSREQAEFYREEEFPGHPYTIYELKSPRGGYGPL